MEQPSPMRWWEPVRRPLATWTFAFAFGIFLQYYFEKTLWIAVAAFVLYFCTGAVRGSCPGISLMVTLLLSGFCFGSLMMCLENGRGCPYTIGQGQIQGVVQEVQAEEAYFRMKVSTGFRQRVLVTAQGTPTEMGLKTFADLVGREIRASGDISLPPGRKNPGCFDYQLYLRTKDVFAVLKAPRGGISVVSQRNVSRPASHQLALLKERFCQRIKASCPEDISGLLLGMVFGDKSSLGDSLYEAFQKNGTAHLLAVSGIHVNVIYMYIRRLLGGRRDFLSSSFVLLFLLTYAALAGFSPSVVRASLMITFSIAAILTRRDYDMLTGTAAAALLLLAIQPYQLFDLGFQLSFLAVLSLSVILPWTEMKSAKLADHWKKKWVQQAADLAAPMAAIQGTMAPITAYCFQYFSWSSFILNPILIPLAGIVVPVGLALFPISFIPGAVGRFLFDAGLNAAALPAKAMILCSQFFVERNAGFFSVASPPMGTILLFYAAIFFLCSEGCYILRRKGNGKAAVLIFTAIFVFSSFFPFAAGAADGPFILSRRTYPMVFVDVGQGDCLHIRTPGGKNILIDGGGSLNYNVGKKTLAAYLLKNGVDHIDLALATHLHADHYRGLLELAAVIPVKRLGIYQGNRVRLKEIQEEWDAFGIDSKREPQLMGLKRGDRIQLENGISVDVLAPEPRSEAEYRELIADETDENVFSLVMMVRYGGLSAMMTGDMGFEGEQALLDRYRGSGESALRADILKTGHHGSRYSTSESFLAAVRPQAAVIQVGKNNFGHPSARVIELFRNSGIMTYRIDQDGAVLVRKIAEGQAVLSDIYEEKIWHISL